MWFPHFLFISVVLAAHAVGSAQEPVVTASLSQPQGEEVILRPKANRNVTEEEDILGQVQPGQIPVVVVRQNIENAAWVVQAPASAVDDTRFRNTVQFGDASTVLPATYQIRVMLITDPAVAAAYRPGMELLSLPEEIPTSREILVFRRGAVINYSILEKPGVTIR